MPDASANAELEFQLELCVQAVGAAPADLATHKALRKLSLEFKAAGGKPPGMVERMRLPYNRQLGLTERLMHVERLLARDPGNTNYMLRIVEVLRDMAESGHHGDVEPVIRWMLAMRGMAHED